MEESTVSQLDVLLEERPRLIMGFLKKKWLKLMSKRKTKVNVSIMSTKLIVQLTFQIPFRYSFPFLLPPISPVQPGHSGHGRVSAPLPNLNFTPFAAIPISGETHAQLQVTREEEQTPRPETPQGWSLRSKIAHS